MNNVNWDAWKFGLDLAQWVVLAVVVIAGWIRTGSNQNRDVINELISRVNQIDRRVVSVEERLSHAPTHEDIAKLQTQVAALEGKLDRVAITLDRIDEYLMNKG